MGHDLHRKFPIIFISILFYAFRIVVVCPSSGQNFFYGTTNLRDVPFSLMSAFFVFSSQYSVGMGCSNFYTFMLIFGHHLTLPIVFVFSIQYDNTVALR